MAFIFLILYVAILLVRPQEWWEPVRGFELVNITAILTIFTTFISQRPSEPLTQVLSRNKFAKFMWGLLAVVVLADLTKLRIRGAADSIGEFGKIGILFFLVMILVDVPRRLRKMMWVIVFCAAAMCLHGIMQIRTGYGFGNVEPFGSFETGDFRVQGTGLFSDPNDFAMVFIVAIAFAFTLFRLRGAALSKALVICIVPAMLVVLYFTKSRGGVAGFCAMLVAGVWIAGRRNLLKLILTGVLLVAVVVFGPARARESYVEGSAGGRIMAWGVGNEILKHSPLFGAGYGRFFDFSGNRAAHSSFVNCYAELGLVGYIVWLGLIWFVSRSVLRIARMTNVLDPTTTKLAAGMFAALAGYLAAAFFLSRTYNPVLFLLLGMGVGLIRYVRRQPGVPVQQLEVTKRDFMRVATIAILSIPAIWIFIRLYWAGTAT